MEATKIIWKNGAFLPWEEAKIHVLTHALHYGDAVFEGIRFYHTTHGPALFKLAEHVERLFYSAGALKMALSYTPAEICAAIKEVIRRNGLSQGYVRPIAFYGYGKMGVNPVGSPVELAIACWPWGAYLPQAGVDVKTSRYIRVHPKTTVADAKLTGNYLNGVLASLELRDTAYHEALFLDSEGHICEGVGENFFIVKSGILYTPPLGNILAGITRATVIQLAQTLGLTVVEQNLTLPTAYAADEAFFTGTAAEVTRIRSLDDKLIGTGPDYPITAQLQQAYQDVVYGKNPAFSSDLTLIASPQEVMQGEQSKYPV